MKKYNLSFILLCFLLFLILTGCTSSNYAKRYGTHSVSEEIKASDIPRFTSEEDLLEIETQEVNSDDLIVFSDENTDDIELFINESKSLTAKELKERFRLTDDSRILATPKNILLYEIVDYLGAPYKFGKSSNTGTDCSGFTRNALEKLNIQIPRSAREQYKLGELVEKDQLKFGDLVFFNTRRRSFPGHVGIFLGEDLFVHASTKKGVIVSSMDETYYKKRYVGAKRITTFENDNQIIGDKNDL